MKRIIDGKTYNTETSTVIAELHEGATVLCVTRGGAFFTVNSSDEYLDFRPATRDNAEELCQGKWGAVELLNTEIFAEPPEAAEDEAPEGTIYLRVPAPLKRQIDNVAKDKGQSVNAWVMRCVEKCLSPGQIRAV